MCSTTRFRLVEGDDLALRIRSWMLYSGKTQAEIALACGVGISAVAQWKSGATQPKFGHLRAFVAECGISLKTFFGALPDLEDPRAVAR